MRLVRTDEAGDLVDVTDTVTDMAEVIAAFTPAKTMN
jgi:hypothetical protein